MQKTSRPRDKPFRRASARGGATSNGRIMLPLNLSERRALLALGDLVATYLSLLFVMYWRLDTPRSWEATSDHVTWFSLLGAAWFSAATLLQSYDLRHLRTRSKCISAGFVTAGATAVAYLSIPYISPPLLASRLTAAAFLASMVLLVSLNRLLFFALLKHPRFTRRAIFVGNGPQSAILLKAISRAARYEYEIVGAIGGGQEQQESAGSRIPAVDTSSGIASLARAMDVQEVILDTNTSGQIDPTLLRDLVDCRESGIVVSDAGSVYEQVTRRVSIEHSSNSVQVFLGTSGEILRVSAAMKRIGDIAFGLIGLALTLSILVPIALAVKADSSGPILYIQERVGKRGRIFKLFKFRTMVVGAESSEAKWATDPDPRATRVGRILRQLHIDELPQSINILRGDMSLVGPRPERPEFVDSLAEKIPFYRARHTIKPGVTGWAQVNYGYGRSVKDALTKLEYDLYYVKHFSFLLDASIVVQTVGRVFRPERKRPVRRTGGQAWASTRSVSAAPGSRES